MCLYRKISFVAGCSNNSDPLTARPHAPLPEHICDLSVGLCTAES